jgi:hypothetical protein
VRDLTFYDERVDIGRPRVGLIMSGGGGSSTTQNTTGALSLPLVPSASRMTSVKGLSGADFPRRNPKPSFEGPDKSAFRSVADCSGHP